jgi:hypothetical protein
VEPEKGRFTFVETDYQIDRPLRHGLSVLALLPFPSSTWSSSAAGRPGAGGRYEERRAVLAQAPRDLQEFEDYVERTVAHYRERVTWWQVFNEPLFTSYALPRANGYDGAAYARYTRAFVRAARRADPRSKILAGIGYLREGQILEDFEAFFAAGGLEVIDAVDIHYYPRIRPPEFMEELLEKLGALMEQHGGRKPVWLTEYGYYADDEPAVLPMPNQGFNQPLRNEVLQAAHAVRWATILLAGGVEKIFYHAGTCAGVNGDSLQGVFYEYGGEPHKIYAAQAVLSQVFSPACRFVQRLDLGEETRGYLFRAGARSVAVVWSPRQARQVKTGTPRREISLASEKLRLWDIMGRELPSRRFVPTGTPVYVVGDGLDAGVFEASLKTSF